MFEPAADVAILFQTHDQHFTIWKYDHSIKTQQLKHKSCFGKNGDFFLFHHLINTSFSKFQKLLSSQHSLSNTFAIKTSEQLILSENWNCYFFKWNMLYCSSTVLHLQHSQQVLPHALVFTYYPRLSVDSHLTGSKHLYALVSFTQQQHPNFAAVLENLIPKYSCSSILSTLKAWVAHQPFMANTKDSHDYWRDN